MLEIRTLAWLSAPPALLAVLVARVAAQTSSAVCMPAFGWMNNSKGQTPCLVAAYLASACDTPSVVDTVDALVPGNEYELPPGPIATVCRCNTVYYSAISACAACQNGSYVTWTTWKEACVSSIVDQFPKDIPQDTAVPAWAFLDVTTSNRFNLTAAEAFAAHAITESTLLLVPTLSFSMPGSPFSFTPASSTGHTGPAGDRQHG
ncbi:hypothetical protein BDW22DRAFT_218707 [Trametopsis cervina]|nr:hypothetical protein BDW22DRAFT_218707 [Trametopsis cervina]